VICATITWLNAPEEHPRKADMAHVKSRGAGGQDILSNVRNLCHRCHTRNIQKARMASRVLANWR